MKLTYKWLKSFIDLSVDLNTVLEILSNIGLEVEDYDNKEEIYSQFIIAEIIEVCKHPNASKLSVCKVNNGKEILQIVCGASNVRPGMKVVLAPVDSVIPSNKMVIKKSSIREVDSNGMLCSEQELLLGNDHDGIIEVLDNKIKLGTKFSDVYNLNDIVIDINLTPNRGDCASVYGIVRDLSAKDIGKLKSKYLNFSQNNFEFGQNIDGIKISIDSEYCYEIAFCKIKNINNNLEIKRDILSFFKLVDLKSHNPVVDISNFSMHEFGSPNHIYDADKIKGNIQIRLSEEGEFFKSLDNNEYNLPKDILVISDDEKILSIAGIIGGADSKVDESTKNILIEVANFSPEQISKSVRKLNIRTESSFRFERRIDHANTAAFINNLVNLLLENCGGNISNSVLIKSSEPKHIKQLKINYNVINKVLGSKLMTNEIDSILSNLGFLKEKDEIFNIPSWRQGDIENNADIAEEIIRIKGLENLESNNKYLYAIEDLRIKTHDFESIFRKMLVGRNLFEIISWSFISQAYANLFTNGDDIKLANPISNEFAIMRNSLIPGLLQTVKNNILKGIKDLSFFEIGKVYYDHNNSLIERKSLTILRTGYAIDKNIFSKQRKFDFYDLKDDVFSLLDEIKMSPQNIIIHKVDNNIYHPGKSIALYIGKKLIGYVGELHPKILKKFNMKQNVYCGEIFFDNLPNKNLEKRKPMFLSQLQSISRDFAIYIDDDTESNEIIKSIKSLKIDMLESINIFDVYKDPQDTLNRKSVAFSVKLQPKLKTLIDQEIEDISNKIIKVLKQNLNAELRDS